MLLLGLIALVLDLRPPARPVSAAVAGDAVPLRLEELEGPALRLLPGVGPVLGERLEGARRAAGGRLDPTSAGAVRGVGPALLGRWEALRPR